MTEEGEVPAPKEISFSGNPMTYEKLLEAQKKLRENNRPTIPFIPDKFAPNYPAMMELRQQLKNKHLEADHSHALGGVTIFIDSEDDFNNLHEFLQENDFEVNITQIKN